MLRIGVIGVGRWGQNHLRVFSELACDLVGLADLDVAKRELAERYSVEYKEDYHDLLSLVDAVSVATPADTHYRIATDCLLAGKHVFVEKPLALNSTEAREIVDLANREKLVLAVGYLLRFNPAVVKLKEELRNVGHIHYIALSSVHSNESLPKDSGIIFDVASHLFDILNFVLGKMPQRIFCKMIHYLSQEREECALISLDYGDFIASLEVSCFHPLKKRDAWVIASKQAIYVDFLEQRVIKYASEIAPDKAVNRDILDVEIDKREPLEGELRHFIECIENKREPVNSGEEGCLTTRLCELALESAAKGKELTV